MSITITVPWGGEDQKTRAEVARMPGMGALLGFLDDPTAPWEIAVEWETGDSGPRAVQVAMRSRRGEPVTPEAWRGVRLSEVIEESRQVLLAIIERKPPASVRTQVEALARAAAETPPGMVGAARRGRPRAFDDRHYQRVADLYRKAVRGGSRTPVREVARELAPEFPRLDARGDARAKTWVREARRRGFLEDGKGDEHGA